MRLGFWVKFDYGSPELWRRSSFEEFWNDLRETMLRKPCRLEWIICE